MIGLPRFKRLHAGLALVPARRCHKYLFELGGIFLFFLVGLGDCLELLRFVFDGCWIVLVFFLGIG